MGRYIKLFNTVLEYQAYTSDISKFILPNVSLCEDLNKPYFNPFTGSKILCKYNVTSTESATTLLGNTNNISSMIVDDVEQEVENSYTFDKTGEHTVLFTLADGVTSIDMNAFSNCSALTSVIIGNSVTSIDTAAFEKCSALTSVTIPDSVTSIGPGAFAYCSALTSVTIPDSVTYINNAAFQYCSALTSVTIPDSVTYIGAGVFNNCSGLTSVTIPDSVTTLSIGAFSYCSALTNINIPDSVISIDSTAFAGCSKLTSITIPDSVTSIGSAAFGSCSALTNIICNATTAPSILSNTFQGIKSGGILTVPVGSTGYDAWMGTGDYYLGKYNWTKVEQ